MHRCMGIRYDWLAAMNTCVVMILLAIVCIQFTFVNRNYSIIPFCRAIFLASNNLTESLSIHDAFGEVPNDLQKQNIKAITDDYSHTTSTIRGNSSSSNNNTVDKKQASNQSWNINFISLVIDSVSSAYRMFCCIRIILCSCYCNWDNRCEKTFSLQGNYPYNRCTSVSPYPWFFSCGNCIFHNFV
jgi:hypothetical protein